MGANYNPRMETTRLRRVDLIGVPLDLGAGRRGVDMGPSAIRIAGLSGRLIELGHTVVDRGDVPVPIPETIPVTGERKRYIAEIAAVCRRLADLTFEAVSGERTPVCVGGDHSLAAGSVSSEERRRGT